MSYTFSRRAFFKYSAAAAIAVAGMSLLGGCTNGDPNNPVGTAVGTTLAVLQVTGTLEKDGTNVEGGVFKLTLKNARGIPLILTKNNFSVAILKEDGKTSKYYSGNENGVKLSGLTDLTVDNGKSATFTVEAPNFPGVEAGETVILKYMPVTTSQYSGSSMAWRIKKEAPASSDTTGAGGTTTA